MNLSKHLETAADAVKRRNYPFAVKLYSQLLALQPDSGEARAGLRNALFKKAEQKPPSKVFAILGGGLHLVVGGLSRMIGRHASAAKSYERYLSLDPLSESINLKLAASLIGAGHEKSALAVYQAFAHHQPRCLEASRAAGAMLYAAGDHQGAMTMYEQALKVDPRDQESLKARKNLAAEGALRSSGIEDAKHSRDLMKDAAAQAKLEKQKRLQLSAEEIEAELDELEAKVAENAGDVAILTRLGELHGMRGDRQSALDVLERVVDLAPDRTEVADKVGDLRLELQSERVQKARERGDDSAAGLAERALFDAQVHEYRRRAENNPSDLGLKFDLGRSLFLTGAHDEAIAELQQAVKDPRRKADALFSLGRAFGAKDLGDLAVAQFEKALDAVRAGSSLAKDVRYELAETLSGLGRNDDALRHLSQILEEDIGYRDVSTKVQELKQANN